MREMWRIRVGMRGMGWECGCGESAWECRESGWECKKCGESGWRRRESRWKPKYIGRNGKFKVWGEVRIIENEHICESLVSHIWSGAFLLNFGHISHNVCLFFHWFWTGKYRLERLSKMEDLCHFQINSFSSSFLDL